MNENVKQIEKEILEKYEEHWKKMDELIKNGTIKNETDDAKYQEAFQKELTSFIDKRKKELNINSTSK